MTTYALPNEHGHYVEEICIVFEHKDKRSYMRIRVIEESAGSFLTGYDFAYGCGNFSGSCGGPSSGDWAKRFASIEDAVAHERQHALKHFDIDKLTDSLATEEQRRIATEFTRLLTGGWPFNSTASASKPIYDAPPTTLQAPLFEPSAQAQLSLF